MTSNVWVLLEDVICLQTNITELISGTDARISISVSFLTTVNYCCKQQFERKMSWKCLYFNFIKHRKPIESAVSNTLPVIPDAPPPEPFPPWLPPLPPGLPPLPPGLLLLLCGLPPLPPTLLFAEELLAPPWHCPSILTIKQYVQEFIKYALKKLGKTIRKQAKYRYWGDRNKRRNFTIIFYSNLWKQREAIRKKTQSHDVIAFDKHEYSWNMKIYSTKKNRKNDFS